MGYDDVTRQRVGLAGERITLRHKAGLPVWDEVEMAVVLIAEEAQISPGMRVLVLQSGGGALAVWAARQGATVECADGSIVATRITQATLDTNDVEAVVHAATVPETATDFDVVLLTLPKGRTLSQKMLVAAHRALKPNGRLYFAGPNAGGAKVLVKDAAAIFGQAATIRTKARFRVAVAAKIGEAPDYSEFLQEASHTVNDLTLFGVPGVFSWKQLDDGTARLLDVLDPKWCEEKTVLDVGCGSGIIGFSVARLGAASVDMVDVSWDAVRCVEQGIAENKFGDVCHVLASDLYSDLGEKTYDLIVSNPPFHAGHKVDKGAAEAMISGARARLNKGGRLVIVANLFLAYDRVMRDGFGEKRVTVLKEDTRYRVIQAMR